MAKRDSVSKLRALLTYVTKKVELVAEGKREIFIFGAGNTTALYEKCFEVEGIKPAGILDNDPKKQGIIYPNGGGYSPLQSCRGVKTFSY